MTREAFAVTRYLCDRCKHRSTSFLPGNEQKYPISDWALLALTWVDGTETFDLCGQCATQLANGIANYTQTRAAASPVRLPEPPDEDPS